MKLKLKHLLSAYKKPEDIRIASIVLGTIFALIAAYLIVVGLAFLLKDVTQIIIILIGGILQVIPITLLFKGYLRLSSLFFFLIVVVSLTISATHGQGIHDIAILSFPVLIFFADLIMQRRDFLGSSILILAAMGYLGFGEALGWYIPKTYETPVEVDFIIAIIILIIAILIADSLAENIRKNMQLAQKEINLRKKMQAELRHLNIHDNLTGIYNRAFFEEVLAMMERSREYPVSIIFADLDNFKEINDKQGHAVGDELLKRTTNTLFSAFRAGDTLARIGGDEFAILLPHTDSTAVNIILSRLRTKLTEYNTRNPDLPIQISLGSSTAEKGELKKAMIRADREMYEDKAIRKSK